MKSALILIGFFSCLNFSFAEETQSEKVKVQVNKVGRKSKNAVNLTKEAMCGKLTGDSRTQCLGKKAGHRIEEGADAIKDKASEVKGKVDSNGKH